MQLHNVKLPKGKKVQRVGRGGKRGTTAGRGSHGQKSRAGRKMRPASRDLIMRIPKHRGFRNKPTSPKPFVLNLSDLTKLKADKGAAAVNREALIAAKLLPKNYRGPVKLLGKGEITFPVNVEIKVSKGVRAKIEAAKGKVV